MRHRASRPLADLLHRVPRAAAHLLGQAAERVPIRALGILMTASILGIGGYVAIGSVTEGSSTRAIDPAGSAAADDAERPEPDSETPGTEGRKSDGSSPEPGTSAPGQPKAPSSPSDEPPSSSTAPDQETGSPSTTPTDPTTPHTTQSTNPSQASPSTRKPGDKTPPDTSLSEEYPEPDAARFSFTANEGASFTCSLDGAAYTACDSPTSYTGLEPGWHTFSVRATDSAGNVDPSPASTRWHASKGNSEDE